MPLQAKRETRSSAPPNAVPGFAKVPSVPEGLTHADTEADGNASPLGHGPTYGG